MKKENTLSSFNQKLKKIKSIKLCFESLHWRTHTTWGNVTLHGAVWMFPWNPQITKPDLKWSRKPAPENIDLLYCFISFFCVSLWIWLFILMPKIEPRASCTHRLSLGYISNWNYMFFKYWYRKKAKLNLDKN